MLGTDNDYSEATKQTTIHGKVTAITNHTDSDSLDVKGEDITIDGTVGVYGDSSESKTTKAAIGTTNTKNVTLKDTVTVQNKNWKLTLDGQNITAAKEVSAGNGAAMTVGSDATGSVTGTYHVDGTDSTVTVTTNNLDGTLTTSNGGTLKADVARRFNGTTQAGGNNMTVGTYSFGLYDTLVRNDGQHWGFNFKFQRLSDDFHYTALNRRSSGSADATGVTFGVEYGYKRRTAKGWFAEPQAFAKADWYHDFGGQNTLALTTTRDNLRLRSDYADNWFEYGLGLSWSLNKGTQFYADVDRGDGSSYDKDWSWNVGMRYSF